MSNKDDGNAAFPMPASENNREWYGMSLRDYFAAKAMQGICAHADTWGLATSPKIANAAYELADAMLTERDK